MEIRVLRYFLTVVREESITKASEVLHITQPTLSRQLAQMEEDIGVKLFDRGTRKIKLTNEGILLRRRAEEILQLVDKTEKELVEQEEQVEGKISIGCGEIAAVQLLPKIIESFRQKYPRVTFDIFTATADLVKEQMDKGLLDIGLLLEPVDMVKYEFIRLNIREKWVVLMKSDDPLSKKETVSAKDLSVLPLILPRRMNVQSELASWFGNYYMESYDFSGKTIVPFCTSGGSGIGSSASNLERLTSGATWLDGRRLNGSDSQDTVMEWVNSLDLNLAE